MFVQKNNNRDHKNGTKRNNNDENNDNKRASSKAKVKASSSPPQTVSICGIDVHFPFTPYPNQKTYMETVMNALHNSENALLESPTGTGKTLCLLCSTLAWQMEQRSKLNDTNDDDDNVTQQQQQQQHSTSTNIVSGQRRRVPTIIYASRTHSQLSQVVKELRFTRYRPNHAVLGSREQMCVHPKINPTKSKTASKTKSNSSSKYNNNTSCSNHPNQDVNHGCAKITKDRKCRYRNNLEGFTAPNDETTSSSSSTVMKNAQQAVLDIEELVSLGQSREICPFYYTKSQIQNADVIFIPYNYLFDNDARNNSLSEVEFENSIIIFDEAHNLESFASESASFDLNSVDIAGCVSEIQRCIGYKESNSVLKNGGDDTKLSMDNLIKLKNIFLKLEHYLDNVIPSAGGSFSGEYIFDIFANSCQITWNSYQVFVAFCKDVSDEIMDAKGGINTSGTPKLDHFVSCVKKVFGTSSRNSCNVQLESMARARNYRVHITPSSKNGGRVGHGQGRTLSYWCFSPALSMTSLAGLKVRSILVTSGTLSPLPSYSLELGLPFVHTLENEHIISNEQIMVRVIGKGVSGKELTSTYNRRDDVEYIMELGNTIISLSRVIPGGVLIFFPSYGVMETCIERWGGPSSSRSRSHNYTNKSNFFQARKSRNNHTSTSGVGRYSFPRAIATGTNLTPWQRLLTNKAIVLEPRSTAELKDVIDEFDKFIDMPKSSGCILMGVCRGKISEGIDFADDKCRAVIITGLPFAPYLDPKVKLKREYLDSIKAAMTSNQGQGGFATETTSNSDKDKFTGNMALSGAEWYSQQAHRAVNQAIGRVIRHRDDYGAILFLDARYNEPRNQQGVSKWIRPRFEPDKGVGVAIGSLVRFYKEAQSRNPVKPTLKYETKPLQVKIEKNIMDDVTKVAFIKSEKSDCGVESNTGYIPDDRIIKKDIQLKDHTFTRDNGVNNESSVASKIRNRMQAQTKHRSMESTDKQSKESAKLFFNLAQTCLSLSDFNAMRNTLITMKSSGDKKDSEAYLVQAKKLLNILLQYDPSRVDTASNNEGSENLVELFLPLLPISYRYIIEKMACKIRYDNSTFKDECRKRLDAEACDIIDGKIVSLMLNRHRVTGKVSTDLGSQNTYLGDYHVVLEIILKHNDGLGLIVKHLYSLIPKGNVSIVRTLVQEYQARKRMKLMKDKDRTKYGESGLKTVLFHKPQERNWKVGIKHEPTTENSLDEVIEMKEALFRANTMKSEHQQAWEVSRNKLLSQQLKRKQSNNMITKGHKTTKILKPHNKDTSIFAKRQIKTKPIVTSADDVDKCLKVANAEICAKNISPQTIKMHHVKSNAPRGMICIICNNSAKEVLMAECNHFACSSCWDEWLKRSLTCPTCRKATSKATLMKAVFHEPNKTLPSLTQMCESDEDSFSDDEDELEIINK